MTQRRAALMALAWTVVFAVMHATNTHSKTPSWGEKSASNAEKGLVAKYGDAQKERAERGVKQVLSFWREEDGDAATFEAFVLDNFAGDQATLDAMFTRIQSHLEQLDGHMNEIVISFREQIDLDVGAIDPFDEAFAAYDPGAHVSQDFFNNKIAFVVLLNFPLTTLDERMNDGKNWSRRQWAEARLTQRFSRRVPAEVSQAISKARAVAGQYIAGYNIWMHHLLNDDGERMFPAEMRLLSHWNLRDEIKAQYSNGAEGLPKQQMIQTVLDRIVTQTIPEVVVDNPHVDWNPYSNEVTAAAVSDSDQPVPENMRISNDPEPDTRYEVLLGTYQAARLQDPYSPTAPTLIARRFDENREIPEEQVQGMFEAALSSPLLKKTGALIAERLGRELEPFDIWYNGFVPRGEYTEAQLDDITRKLYPTAAAFEKDIPRMLVELGFDKDRAQYLADNIIVQPARGSGHAWGAEMKGEMARLRTRVGKDGMDYKGFNIAVHELGHNVEQTISLNNVDYWLLRGVPNTAFTEALAFVFQAEDLALIDLAQDDPKAHAMKVLDEYWGMCEIGSVALVDMAVWHWMYDNPDATPAQLKAATIDIAKDIWNKYWAPVIGKKDSVLLGVYSHMISSFLYLPDYPIGHTIAFQIGETMKKKGIGAEFERCSIIGNIAPDLWMKEATGSPVGVEALLEATEKALGEMEMSRR